MARREAGFVLSTETPKDVGLEPPITMDIQAHGQ